MAETGQPLQMRMAPSVSAATRQTLKLSARQMQGIRLLAQSLPELRAEIAAEMSRNPAIEDVEHPLEAPLSDVEERRAEDDHLPDYPEDDYEPQLVPDEEAQEKRQSFFDNQVKSETLQEHLTAQLPFSEIPQKDWPLAEVLIGDLDGNGYYRGSLADAEMSFGCNEAEVLEVLEKISDLDPTGCGARTPQDCLMAQIDKLENSPVAGLVIQLIENHLEDLGAGRLERVCEALKITREQLGAALQALRTLDPFPGRDFPGEKDRVEYVNPEIHAVRRQGRWVPETDRRSLPEIRLSTAFSAILADPKALPETKAYVKERIASAEHFREAIEKRQETIERIAQIVFDRQQDFFTEGFKALKPLTETEVAKEVGLDVATISRTVCNKYVSTPKGTIELRRFFVTTIKNAQGDEISQHAIQERIREIVRSEEPLQPFSDEKIKAKLEESGFPIARRTVAKYREAIGIPGTSERRQRALAAGFRSPSSATAD